MSSEIYGLTPATFRGKRVGMVLRLILWIFAPMAIGLGGTWAYTRTARYRAWLREREYRRLAAARDSHTCPSCLEQVTDFQRAHYESPYWHHENCYRNLLTPRSYQ